MAMAANSDGREHDGLPAGALLGHWRIAKLLGEGGMGRVYLAEHAAIGRKVALKVLKRSLARSPELVERFFAEAHAVNRIRHPGIVEVTDCFIAEDGTPCIVMELLIGRTVTEEMAATRIHPVRVAHIGAEVADALDAAHQAGVIHRDLKPDNLFLVEPTRPGDVSVVKVLDFGVAKLMDPMPNSTVHTVAGSIMGTPDYMAPEQLAGKPVDARADIYALGASLYHACTGRPPFPASNFGDLVVMHMTKPPTPPTCFANLPAALEQVLLAMLEKDPGRRPQTMGDVALLLRSAQKLGAGMRYSIAPAPFSSTLACDARALAEADERARALGPHALLGGREADPSPSDLVVASTLSPRAWMPAPGAKARDGSTQTFLASEAGVDADDRGARGASGAGPVIVGALMDAHAGHAANTHDANDASMADARREHGEHAHASNVPEGGSFPPSGTLLLGSAEAPEVFDDIDANGRNGNGNGNGNNGGNADIHDVAASRPLSSWIAPHFAGHEVPPTVSPADAPGIVLPRLASHLPPHLAGKRDRDDGLEEDDHDAEFSPFAHAQHAPAWAWAALGAVLCFAVLAALWQVQPAAASTPLAPGAQGGPIASSESSEDEVDPFAAGGLAILEAVHEDDDVGGRQLDEEGAVRSDAPALTSTVLDRGAAVLEDARPAKITKKAKPKRRVHRTKKPQAQESEAVVGARRRAVLDPFAEQPR